MGFTKEYVLCKIYFVTIKYFGGVPERLIGAVLKTVERASVPWVRIPPPPYKNGLTFVGPVFIFCGKDVLNVTELCPLSQ